VTFLYSLKCLTWLKVFVYSINIVDKYYINLNILFQKKFILGIRTKWYKLCEFHHDVEIIKIIMFVKTI